MRAAVLELVYHEADPVVHLALSKCSKVFVCLYTLVCVLEEERLERERERESVFVTVAVCQLSLRGVV